MFVAGDIGGTKTTVALYEEADGSLKQIRDETFKSKEHTSLEQILGKFLRGEKLKAGTFGVAGAVIEGKAQTTNLPWKLDEKALASAIGAPVVKLLNDLEAAAYGMLHLKPEELVPLNPDKPPVRKGHVAVIAAGTGLGEAFLYFDGQKHHPLASEGGHCDFAPRTDIEVELFRHLRDKYKGHVSYERILSGPGYMNVYEFLRDKGYFPESAELKAKLATAEIPSALITQLGQAGTEPICRATNDLFCEVYGAEAGNMALKCVAVGGVYVGGGIAPKMLADLQRGTFWKGFIDKGRFAGLMKTLPVFVSLNPRAPLIGAAHYAASLAGRSA
jgi:glucokinase